MHAGYGLFAAGQAQEDLETVSEEDGVRDHGGERFCAVIFWLAGDTSYLGADSDSGDPVDGAEEIGDEAGARAQVDIFRSADLLDATVVHDSETVGE